MHSCLQSPSIPQNQFLAPLLQCIFIVFSSSSSSSSRKRNCVRTASSNLPPYPFLLLTYLWLLQSLYLSFLMSLSFVSLLLSHIQSRNSSIVLFCLCRLSVLKINFCESLLEYPPTKTDLFSSHIYRISK